MHADLRRLEAAGLVRGRLELSEEAKALKFFEVTPFALELTPQAVAAAAEMLAARDDAEER